MAAALIIVFREVIEAGLIVGIVLAATRGVPGRSLWVGYGIGGGVAGAGIVALFAGAIGSAFAGSGQELFNATILTIAVLMLGWHNVWMARHGRAMAAEVKAVGEAVAAGNRTLAALAIVVGIAVLREGSEVVLFLYGVAVSGNDTAAAMGTGGAIGVLLGAGTSALMYYGLLRIPARYLFSVTSWLIALLAAGLAAQAAAFLQAAGVVTAFAQTMWDTSRILADGSLPGRVLHTLIGYTDRPTALQLAVYVATLATIFVLMRMFGSQPRQSNATRA
ncbi:MAG: FTR1 family protein [Alphaproteobacteria bacterium]|nr:FTR1 family protein [Alphaproteobacteria bacterium]